MSIQNNPLVSVVIPTHNRANYVVRAVHSVLSQTYQNIECIVIDDASVDNTAQVLSDFDDPRLIYLRNTTNIKAPASRNRGIKAAHGELIALLDDDDLWLPKKLEKQVPHYAQVSNQVGVVYSGFYYVIESTGKKIKTVIPVCKGDVYTNLLSTCILGSPTPLIRKAYFTKSGYFDETLPGAQDWDMWLRLAKHCEFSFVPEPLAEHHIHGAQISTNLAGKIEARTMLLEKHHKEINKYPRILRQHLIRLAMLHFLDKQPGGRGLIIESIKALTIHPVGYIHLGLSLFPPLYRKILEKRSVMTAENIRFYY